MSSISTREKKGIFFFSATNIYLANAAGPVPLVLDLRLAHDRFGSSSDPTLNGRLHYNDVDKSLNEAANDKIRKYHEDYINNPPNSVVFIPDIVGTNGRLHSDSIRLLFLQAHRETDRFFADSGVQLNNNNVTSFSATSSSRLETMVATPWRGLRLFVSDWVSVGIPSCLDRALVHRIRGFLVC